jgi:1-pyrroline-4-hydroxy-2-carboxylate deaminase
LIKLVQQELGIGNARVRAPKLEIVGEELEATNRIIRHAIHNRPKNASSALAHAAR